jgi:hypothetical protein
MWVWRLCRFAGFEQAARRLVIAQCGTMIPVTPSAEMPVLSTVSSGQDSPPRSLRSAAINQLQRFIRWNLGGLT